MRARYAWEARSLGQGYAAALWAMEKHLKSSNRAAAEKIRELRLEVTREFGLLSAAAAHLLGPLLLWSARREEKRLAAGETYEPKTIVERKNWTPETPLRAPSLPVLRPQEE